MDPVQFYKCLADETRLTSLLLIAKEEELCVCELMEALEESQPKISRHLALLRKAEILSDRRQGQWVFYRLNPKLPNWTLHVLKETTQNNHAFLHASTKRLTRMGQRPERSRTCC